MTEAVSRRFFLTSSAAAVVTGSAALAAPPKASLRPVLRADDFFKKAVPDFETILRAQKLSGRVAYALADAETGQWLECENELATTPPASTAKAITALYALDALGAEHRFETRLWATGGIADGVIGGDLILIGGGDPTLDTDGLADMAAKLKALGIKSVKGAFKVYEGHLPVLRQIDPEQPDQVGYNPGVSGLALNFNRVHFEWKRAGATYAVTMQGRTEKYRPDVGMAVMQVRDRTLPVFTYEDRAGRDTWTVARGALGNGGSRWLPVRKPGLYAGDVFATLAAAQGIRLGRPQMIQTLPQGGDLLIARASPPLLGILRDMLRYSTNITAEMVGLSASVARGGAVADIRASAAQMNSWAVQKLGMKAPGFVDHSGLGDDSEITVVDMARGILAVNASELRPILKPFWLRDGEGKILRDHPVKVDAKTGTLNFVSGLTGYMTTASGRDVVFAILASDMDIRAGISRAERERPPGARTWNRKAKRVQQALIERWDVLYGDGALERG
ncbi:MAG: D-alanyl-D-alanine carboxypeptidase/D-alanyl-D-alanine-endopeptidase [Pseudomonadota bacterium]